MRIVVFFVYLCFLLLGGSGNSHASIHQSGYKYSQSKLKFTDINPGYTFVSDTDADEEDFFIADDDAEDEDSDELFIKKCRLLSQYYSALANQLLLDSNPRSFKAVPFFFGQIADIYLVQRVLKI
jgi:hypothetical protein